MGWLHRLGFVAERTAPGAHDAALLARVQQGDASALAQLYRRESGAVYRYALALAHDETLALDAVQEAFTQLLQAPAGYDPARAPLGAYLAGIARHHLLARWRQAQRQVGLDDAAPDTWVPGEATDPATDDLLVHAGERADRAAWLWAGIRQLSGSQQEALVLVDLQERTPTEAAAVVGVSPEVLRTRLHRARARLAQVLNAGDRV